MKLQRDNSKRRLQPKELEELWRERLEDAKAALDFAYTHAQESAADMTPGTLSDRLFLFRTAIHAENVARAEYNRVLRIYAALLINGSFPDEEDRA